VNGLSLCAGIGGLDLGVEIALPGYRTIAAVEHNAEAARRFKIRFPAAKVFRDVVDGVARWMVERRARLQCGGNGVVPLQAAAVITELAERLGIWLKT
jgi:site-specific DNA-cytosine methylase